eukprot:1346026-Pyramimonas_sp.AAC.1
MTDRADQLAVVAPDDPDAGLALDGLKLELPPLLRGACESVRRPEKPQYLVLLHAEGLADIRGRVGVDLSRLL